MELNCSYCKDCDTLWDNKVIDADGLCPDCEKPTLEMIARPTNAAANASPFDGTPILSA